LACEFRTEEGKKKREKSEDKEREFNLIQIRYPASHPFASLQGSDNIIKFTTKYFPNGVIVQVKKNDSFVL
jgi:homoserine dehydrogenase